MICPLPCAAIWIQTRDGLPVKTGRIVTRSCYVILDLGYFIGKLGRKNVCAIKLSDLEIPRRWLCMAQRELIWPPPQARGKRHAENTNGQAQTRTHRAAGQRGAPLNQAR